MANSGGRSESVIDVWDPNAVSVAHVAPGEGHLNTLVLPTWIEIQLLGEDDKPIPDERYRITLADGRCIEGKLDAQGCARVVGLWHGLCDVTFPDLDTDAWTRIKDGS